MIDALQTHIAALELASGVSSIKVSPSASASPTASTDSQSSATAVPATIVEETAAAAEAPNNANE